VDEAHAGHASKGRHRIGVDQRGSGRSDWSTICRRHSDLEAIVAKWAPGVYRTDGRATSWLQIKNPDYTQMQDRHELLASRQTAGPRRRAQQRPDLALR